MPGSDVAVTAGAILAYRLFDVAYEIDLAMAEEVWARTVRTGSSRGRLTTTPPKAVAFDVPPVALDLGVIDLDLPEGPVQAAATARLFDFGVISIALRVKVAGLSWAAFSQRMNAVDVTVGLAPASALWTGLLDRVRSGVGAALIRSRPIDPGGGLPRRRRQQLQRADAVRGAAGAARPGAAAVRRAPAAVGAGAAGFVAASVFLLHGRSRGADLGSRVHLRAARRHGRDRRARGGERPVARDAVLRRAAG